MSSPVRWPAAVAGLTGLAWAGAVLWRYQRVDPPHALAALLAAGVFLAAFTLAALGPGWLVWRAVAGTPPRGAAAFVVALAAGAGALAGAAALLALLGALRPVPVACTGLAAALGGAAVCRGALLRRGAGGRAAGWRQELVAPTLLLGAAAAVTLAAVPTLAPFYDQFNYHLAFPYHWLRAGHLVVQPRHSYSFLPATMGLLFTYPLATVGPWAAQAIHWWTGALATAAAGVLARRLAGARAATWAAALFALTPSVMEMAGWAAADLATAAFGLAGWLLVAGDPPRRGGREPAAWWLLAGALGGLAAGSKVLALATVTLPLAVGALLRPAPSHRERWRRAVLLGAGAALTLAPWLARSAALTGNPLYPFFNRLLPPRALVASAGAEVAAAAGMVAQFPAQRLAPAERALLGTFNPQGFAGAIGAAHLALAPAALWAGLAWRRRRAPLLLAGAATSVLGWWFAPQLGRYLAPALGLLAVLAAVGWARLTARAPRAVAVWLSVLLAGTLLWNLTAACAATLDRVACTVGRGSQEELLREQVSCWAAIDLVNDTLPADAKLLLVAESRTLFFDREVVAEDPYVRPLLVGLAETQPSAAAMSAALRRQGITHLLVNHQEAARIAALMGREEYFAPLTPAARARLQAFTAGCLRRVGSAGPCELLTLSGCDG